MMNGLRPPSGHPAGVHHQEENMETREKKLTLYRRPAPALRIMDRSSLLLLWLSPDLCGKAYAGHFTMIAFMGSPLPTVTGKGSEEEWRGVLLKSFFILLPFPGNNAPHPPVGIVGVPMVPRDDMHVAVHDALAGNPADVKTDIVAVR
jgi:hypothetical protein